jgi:hypothetical protein
MKTNSINWCKLKNAVKTFFKQLFTKKVKPTSTSTYIAPDPEVAKKIGKGAAFRNNRKSNKGRIRQQIAMGKDMFGNMHYKVICHYR